MPYLNAIHGTFEQEPVFTAREYATTRFRTLKIIYDTVMKTTPSVTNNALKRLDNPLFPVVGIGASAGGLDAFSRFLSSLPVDPGMAFILVPHLDPNHKSLMVELLSKKSALPVSEVVDGESVQSNHIYIIPPHCSLELREGALHLTPTGDKPDYKTAIDAFLYSLAFDKEERAAAIILSGTGSHGCSGIKHIKLKGGLVLAQKPDTADFKAMPSNAIATGLVDLILPPERMIDELTRYAHSLDHDLADAQVDVGLKTPEPLQKIIALLGKHTKLDFGFYRKSMLLRRVNRRMGLAAADSIDAYIECLREQPEEIAALYRDLLINVSAFFRDPAAFSLLSQRVIPDLVADSAPDKPVRVWVPGCATGEEAWTLAILLYEAFEALGKPPSIQIFATDIDEEALQFARKGVYPESMASELSSARLQRYFIRQTNGHYKVREELRSYIVFAMHNLVGDAPFSQLDLISCRNLLIYLEQKAQQKIISLFHFGLKQNRYLLLGPSEAIRTDEFFFKPVSRKWRIFQRTGTGLNRRIDLPGSSGFIQTQTALGQTYCPSSGTSMSSVMHKELLANFTPASVLIDHQSRVQCFHGPTVNYLEIPAGEPTQDLITMARQGLRTRLRAAIHRAISAQQAVVDNEARVVRNNQYVFCKITVDRIREPGLDLLLVTFTDLPTPSGQSDTEYQSFDEQGIQQLEHELKITREDLQSNIEALEVANEELKASHEEAMSMNEEMQSANEELETSGEELQSLNEELTTVNNQLQVKVLELEQRNDDIANLLISSNIGTLFLDNQLRIKLFTPSIQVLLNLLEQDIGRPLSDFCLKFTDQRLLQDCQAVRDQLTGIEAEVLSNTGSVYLRRIRPYRTKDNRIEGLVITFIDISDRKQAEMQAQRLAQVLRDSNDAIVVQNMTGKITAWNQGACRLYGYSEEQALTLTVQDLIPSSARQANNEMFMRAARNEPMDPIETQRVRQDGQLVDVWLTLTSVTDDTGTVVGLASTERDITQRKQRENELRTLNAELDQLVKSRTEESVAAAMKLSSMYRTAPVLLCSLDNQLRLQSLNTRLAELLLPGDPPEAMVNKPLKDIAPALYNAIEPILHRTLLHKERVSGVEITINPTGKPDQTRTFLCYCDHITKEPSVQAGISVSLQDISLRKQLEEELKEKEHRVSSILDTAVDAIISVNAQGRIELLNHAGEEMFGYTAEELIGQSVRLLIPSTYKSRNDDSFGCFLTGTGTAPDRGSQLLQAVRKDGSVFPIRLTVGEVDHSQNYTGVISDLSQQQALQDQLLNISEQTQRSIGEALHDDIGQEMTGLTLKTESLQQHLSGVSAHAGLAANILEGLDRTRKKIRILSHGLLPVAIDAKGLNDALASLAHDAQDVYRINCRFHADRGVEVHDTEVATQLFHIAQEALNNALRHSQGQNIALLLSRCEKGLLLQISDDGKGLSDENAMKQGSGLQIMRYRAGRIGAEFSIDSTDAPGTRINCYVSGDGVHEKRAEN